MEHTVTMGLVMQSIKCWDVLSGLGEGMDTRLLRSTTTTWSLVSILVVGAVHRA